MKFASWLAFLVLTITCCAAMNAAQAEPPVLVLKRPVPKPHSNNYPALQPMTAGYYPYGYFGAHGGKKWSLHRGWMGEYTQYTRR